MSPNTSDDEEDGDEENGLLNKNKTLDNKHKSNEKLETKQTPDESKKEASDAESCEVADDSDIATNGSEDTAADEDDIYTGKYGHDLLEKIRLVYIPRSDEQNSTIPCLYYN